MSYTFVDFFCGAGGSSSGLHAAGFELVLAANHWDRAIETHAVNFPAADHLCADVNNYDMRRLPWTDIAWWSPICTECSPAGGTPRSSETEWDLEAYGHVSTDAFIRTRATAWDVIRGTEARRHKVVLVENVVEFARDWPLFRVWCDALRTLGYNLQFVSVNSAHVGGPGNPYAPQWRDRFYVVATRKGIPLPDVTPRPLAWCPECAEEVKAVQAWKKTKPGRRQKVTLPEGVKAGKYGAQYEYHCPKAERHPATRVIEPFTRPAADAIDWRNLGKRIGDRAKPLASSTMKRIQSGLDKAAEWQQYGPTLITVNHSDGRDRALPVGAGPLPARTVKIGEGLVTPGLLAPVGGSWTNTPTLLSSPMNTRMANPKGHEALVAMPFVAELRNHKTVQPVANPVGVVTAGGNHHGLVIPGAQAASAWAENLWLAETDGHALVIPYRKGRTRTTREPLHTVTTVDSAALATYAPEIEDCYFRMLQPEEQAAAQRFPRNYIILGNKGERTKQAGNAVSSNVAQWLGECVMKSLAHAA